MTTLQHYNLYYSLQVSRGRVSQVSSCYSRTDLESVGDAPQIPNARPDSKLVVKVLVVVRDANKVLASTSCSAAVALFRYDGPKVAVLDNCQEWHDSRIQQNHAPVCRLLQLKVLWSCCQC